MTSHFRRWGSAVAIALAAVPGCSEPSALLGALAVSVATTGEDLDPDGYAVQVDAGPEQPIGAAGMVRVGDLGPGQHVVELRGVADNCTVLPSDRQTVTVTSADTLSIAFRVSCLGTGIRVTLRAAGLDFKVTGYTIRMSDRTATIPVFGTVAFTRLPPGPYEVRLEGVTANCAVDGENPRAVVVAAHEVLEVLFQISCVATTGVLRVMTATSGIDVDLTGYRVAVGGFSSGAPVNGESIIPALTAGTHQVRLGEVDPNCSVVGDPVRAVTIRAGGSSRDTATTTFQLDCERRWAFAFVRGPRTLLLAEEGGSTLSALGGGGSDPAWSANGRALAYTCDTRICVLDAGRGTTTQLGSGYQYVTDPTWRSDGAEIAFAAWTCDDFYCYGYRVAIVIARVDGAATSAINLPSTPWYMADLDWSPDRNHLALTCQVEMDNDDICLVRVASGSLTHLVGGSASDREPAWKPDGSAIVFTTTRFSESPELAIVQADGSGITRLSPGTAASNPAWLPDGSRIVFTAVHSDPAQRGLFVMNADGTGVVRLTTGFDSRPSWRP